ncbi:MAG: ABC transporter ATP-binding protein [Bdellovibrionaceae bacterium]|nr:ABC transporter ATP-binding protein [Bdellovibrio sp.]
MKLGRKRLIKIIFIERPGQRFLILILSLFSAFLGLALPYYQRFFSETLQLGYLAICIGLSFGYLVFNQLTLLIGQHEAVIAQKKLAHAIYDQYLKLKPLTLQTRSVGEVVSLYTTDVPSLTVWLEQSLPYGLTTLFPLVLAPLFLIYFYALPGYFCFGLVGVLILINGLMAYRQSLFFFKFKKLAADRMGLVNEWIQNIRGLKILNWVEGFENKIIKKRIEETNNRIAMVTNGQVMNSISSSITFWLNLSILGFFIWLHDGPLGKSDMIALLWVTTVFLSRPLRQLPWFFTFVFDAWTSFRRLGDFLGLANIDSTINSNIPSDPHLILEVKNLNLVVDEKKVLQNINLSIRPGQLIALIGPVGAGKSLLMKSLINETPFTADIFFKGSSSYVPQDHFVMSASLRDNMNFDYNSNPSHDPIIMQQLAKAQFSFELDRVQGGLNTLIGERGVNLSGGQKQRVSLARQLMQPRQLLLLDDPLSAIDVTTEKKLVDEFIKLKTAQHSILVTTQRFTILPQCDRILFIDHGQILFDGSAEQFLNDDRFRSFVTGLE